MASFRKDQSISDFQAFGREVYGLVDDQHYSIWELLGHEQRFAMRALKGIRKNDREKLKLNLAIAFSFLMAIGNRLHIDIEDEVWTRFPALCSYCGKKPCVCKTVKQTERRKVRVHSSLKPGSIAGFQKMFDEIYPAEGRTLADAGVHLAEEVGEVTEAVQNFLARHDKRLFDEIRLEIADCVSCIFGVANSARIHFAKDLEKRFAKNCHVCHKAPCACDFYSVAMIKT